MAGGRSDGGGGGAQQGMPCACIARVYTPAAQLVAALLGGQALAAAAPLDSPAVQSGTQRVPTAGQTTRHRCRTTCISPPAACRNPGTTAAAAAAAAAAAMVSGSSRHRWMQGVSMPSVVAFLDQLLPRLRHLTESHNVVPHTVPGPRLSLAVAQAVAAASVALSRSEWVWWFA